MYTQEEIVKAHGPFTPPTEFTEAYIQKNIQTIEEFPALLRAFCEKLKPEQQLAHYREGGWSFRQVVHHLADSHMQAYSRYKLSLTEDKPVIKPYIQNAWADTYDSLHTDWMLSVDLLEALHRRWVILLKSMKYEDFDKIYIHPEYGREYSLAHVSGLYAWHGIHHLTQIQRYAANQGWI